MRSATFYWHALKGGGGAVSALDVAAALALRSDVANQGGEEKEKEEGGKEEEGEAAGSGAPWLPSRPSSPAASHWAKTAAVRVYPEGYSPSVVGMLWSDLAQLQTFFGGDAFLCYGIQMMPVVGGASDALLDAGWLAEAEPEMRRSCYGDEDTAAAAAAAAPPPNDMCTNEGWALLVEMASVAPPSTTAAANDGADGESSSTAVASVGAGALLQQRQEAATAALEAMPPDVFLSAGGNGHSLANCLWFVATRRL